MKYQIVGKNISVTDGISNAIKKKVGKMDKYFHDSEDVDCRAVVRSYKNGAKVEITLKSKDVIFRSEVTNEDLYAAIDFAVDKLEGQMRKLKTKLQKRKDSVGIGKSIVYEEIEDTLTHQNDEIVKTKVINLKPITMEEAIIEMESIGHDFYLYLDTDDEKVSVLYRREEGGYGLLQADNKVNLKA